MNNRLIAFSSSNRIGMVNADSDDEALGGERYLEFPVPGMARWAAGPLFQDGRRIILTSYEDVTLSRVVAGEVVTHTWIYDLVTGAIHEVLTRDKKAPSTTCHTILPGETRLAVNAAINGEERIFTMDWDGANSREVTRAGEGYSYCVTLNPAGDRFAFHVTGSKLVQSRQESWFRPGPYSINTLGVDGQNRVLVVGSPGHLYFGPRWSPAGDWLVYLDCLCEQDPAHFWADLCIGRSDGSEQRVVTTGQNHWFGTTFGSREKRSGGSNIPSWMPDGRRVTYTRAVPGSHPDCDYHPELPDHCECVYTPEAARGGSQICLLDPFSGEVEEITAFEENKWDFRAAPSPDGNSLVFTRARLGQPSELWLVNLDRDDEASPDAPSGSERLLSKGIDGVGADHGRWL